MNNGKIFLNQSRLIGDPEADKLAEDIFKNNSQAALYAAIQLPECDIKNIKGSGPIKSFLLSKRKLPVWFDESRLSGGQQVFNLYASEIMTLLGVMALPYCYAASPGNKALYLADKMRHSPGKRLLDTAHFIIQVSTPGAFSAQQYGHAHIQKTRLIHSIARYYVRQKNWDIAWGVPINQEDMAGTNLAFSMVILMGLQQSGYVLSEKEKEDFIFLWRYIGYQLGIDEQLLPSSFKEAFHLASIIKKRNFKKTMEGITLTKELLSYYHAAVPLSQAKFIDAQVRHYLGPEVAGYIGLEPEYLKDQFTSMISSFTALKNLMVPPTSSFNSMISNHQLLSLQFKSQNSTVNNRGSEK